MGVVIAGPAACRMATSLLRRLEQTHAALMEVRSSLPAVPEAADVLNSYELAHQALQQFVVNTHTQWFNMIDPNLPKELQSNLLLQDRSEGMT